MNPLFGLFLSAFAKGLVKREPAVRRSARIHMTAAIQTDAGLYICAVSSAHTRAAAAARDANSGVIIKGREG